MTSEEMERAIEFLLQSQANLEAQIAETNKIVQMHAESQSQLNETLTKTISALADAQARAESRSNARHDETDARLDRLAAVVEKLAERVGGA
jgi:predicted  nucleic acid-binding Zn-ribbon protein